MVVTWTLNEEQTAESGTFKRGQNSGATSQRMRDVGKVRVMYEKGYVRRVLCTKSVMYEEVSIKMGGESSLFPLRNCKIYVFIVYRPVLSLYWR